MRVLVRTLTAVATEVQRVLLYRLGSLGDTVVALPSFHLVARAFPGAERRLLTNSPVGEKAAAAAAVLADSGLVQGYFEYRVGLRDPAGIVRLWWRLVRWRPEVLVYLAAERGEPARRRDRLFFRLCGITRQVGLAGDTVFHEHLALTDGMWESEAARLVRLIAPLGEADLSDPANWSLHLTAREHSVAEKALAPGGGRPVLALSLGTKQQSGDWTLPNWEALVTRLAGELPGYALALTGVASEQDSSEALARAWRAGNTGPAMNLCGQLTPREAAAVFRAAIVFIGHDSGPMHVAAAAGTPCVAVFSARNKPGVWFPHGRRHRVIHHEVSCGGCGLEICVVERKRCVLSITVEEVAGQVFSLLDELSRGRHTLSFPGV